MAGQTRGASPANHTLRGSELSTGVILIADNEASIRESLAEALQDEGFDVTAVADGNAAITALEHGNIDVLITDLRMPGADGLTVLRRARELAPQTLVVLITAFASVDTAVQALRHGAHDYIVKPLILENVLTKVHRLLDYRQVAWESQMLRREVEDRYDLDAMIVDRSPAMREIIALINKVAPTNSTVLITGESGVGKEIVARTIHHRSKLSDKLFLPVNCTAIPENLLESQLFGHIRGAFTGAVATQEGLFQRARGGTIFLDQISDLTPDLQVKLLRAIDEKEILSVGATTPIKVDLRIIAATNQNLREAVNGGQFREDLFYRLNVIGIEIPPLRERREEIPHLVEFLVRRHNAEMNRSYKGVDNATMKVLMGLPWKGNIRELDNVIEHAMILGDGEWITLRDLPRSVPQDSAGLLVVGDNLREAVHAYEGGHIESVLRRSDNDKRKAAQRLGVSLSSLYRKIAEFGIKIE